MGNDGMSTLPGTFTHVGLVRSLRPDPRHLVSPTSTHAHTCTHNGEVPVLESARENTPPLSLFYLLVDR